MLKKLIVRNYQSHTRSEFNFNKGINVILGDPQSGKTSGILRPILLLLKNRPFGGRFFNNFVGNKGKVRIKLFFTEGGNVSIEKTIIKDKNGIKKLKNTKYVVVDENNKRDNFAKVGKQIPDKALEKINLSDLNIQGQLDIPFLITESASEVTRIINKITRIEKIDIWTTKLTSKINKSNREIDVLENSISSAEKEIEKYKNLSKIENHFKILKKINIKIMTARETIDLLHAIEEGVKDITEDIKKNEVKKKEKSLQKLLNINKKIEQVKKESSFLQKIVFLNISVCDYGKKYRNLKNKYISLLKKIKICPTCLSEIKKKDIKKIKENI